MVGFGKMNDPSGNSSDEHSVIRGLVRAADNGKIDCDP